MKAAVLAEGRLAVEDLALPRPRVGEALVRVAACGVCHTDLHVIEGHVAFPQPAVLGHEIAGVVEEVNGGQQSAVKPGDRVVASFIIPCGNCHNCHIGEQALCSSFFEMNRLRGVLYDGETRLRRHDGEPVWMYSMGGLAEACVVPLTDVIALPDELPLVESSILGCAFLTAYGAVRHAADLRAGQTVAVIGVGGIGTAIMQLARAFGADRIIALDAVEAKLTDAPRHGATHAFVCGEDPRTVELAVMDATDGRGVDVAFDACGGPGTFALAGAVVRDGGAAVIVGLTDSEASGEVGLNRLVRRQVHVRGSYGGRPQADIRELTRLAMRGAISLGGMVTQRFSLEEAAAAYAALAERRISGRAVVVPNGDIEQGDRAQMETSC